MSGPTGATPDKELLAAEIAVLPRVPDDTWITATDDALAGLLDEVETEKMLKRMRRRGWLVCNKRTDPPSWTRTPTGTAALTAILAAA